MKAGFLASLTEASLLPEANAHLDAARALSAAQTPARERGHIEAVQQVAGRPLGRRLPYLGRVCCIDHPRDALALQWAQLWDFYRGDAVALRARARRARCPSGTSTTRCSAHVLALRAFGLGENHLHGRRPRRPAAARSRSIPRAPWAVHSVAHVMDMQGRFDDGAAWLRQHQHGMGRRQRLGHATCGGTPRCFAWKALDIAGDAARGRWPPQRPSTLQIGAAPRRCGVPAVAAAVCSAPTSSSAARRCKPAGTVQGRWRSRPLQPSMTCMPCCRCCCAGDLPGAERWVARCAERRHGRRRRATATTTQLPREVGQPLARGLVAFARERAR